MSKPLQFELFLDESGTFEDTSTRPSERAAARDGQCFPGQLCGVLAPSGSLSAAVASRILGSACRAAGTPFDGTVHPNLLRRGASFDTLLDSVSAQLEQAKLCPVRITNREPVSFGERIDNYTQILAELCLRAFRKLSEQFGERRLHILPVCAFVKVGEGEHGTIQRIKNGDYTKALQTAMTQTAIWTGQSNLASKWRIQQPRIASGMQDPELMVCEVLSNASHDNWGKLSADVAQVVQNRFLLDGVFSYRPFLNRLDEST